MMKTLSIVLACMGVLHLSAQCPTNIEFNSQQSIDSFPILYPGCKAISSDVVINGNSITHLDGLAQIDSIGGSLSIYFCDTLSELKGLEQLRFVGEALNIYGNKNLQSLEALDSLQQVESLQVSNCPALANLNGLGRISTLKGNLDISDNGGLKNLSGLTSLRSVEHALIIEHNIAMTSLRGLDSLTYNGYLFKIFYNPALVELTGLDHSITIAREMVIDANFALTSLQHLSQVNGIKMLTLGGNKALSNLQGLEHIQTLPLGLSIVENNTLSDLYGLQNLHSTGDLRFYGNDSLKTLKGLDSLLSIRTLWVEESRLSDFTGLNNLKQITGQFILHNNPFLTSFAGLENVDSIGMGVHVDYNLNLNYCAIQAICDQFDLFPPNVFFDKNGLGCNSNFEVFQACSSVSQVEPPLTEQFQWDLFPNPSYGLMQILSPGTASLVLKVSDAMGRIVMGWREVSSDYQIDLSNQVPGLYIVNVQVGDHIQSRRMLLIGR